MQRRQGFTLVELMIVVAIIGILAAIAIPNFVAMQYRTKRSEVPNNIDGIKTAQAAYEAAFDAYLQQTTFYPSATPGKAQVPWPAGSNFDDLGWAPDGAVRGVYKLTTLSSTDFLVTGISDVDGDGAIASFTATKSLSAVLAGTPPNVY